MSRSEIKGGIRFALLACPNALCWTITTGFPPEPESIVIHLTINRQQINQEFVEEIDEFQKPVFFGHYWLKGEPNLYRDNICCLDYSVAKNGFLCSYRFNGEDKLLAKNLVYV